MSSTFVNLAASDNKHGECCGCPALMSDGRLLTHWQPKKQFNQRLLNSFNGMDSEQQRYMLQQNPALADIDGMTDERLACRPDAKFYIDSSDFHKQMFAQQMAELQVPQQVNGVVYRQLFPIDGSYKL
jgi:hypothetical protein